MKKTKEKKNNELITDNRMVCIGANINTCIACGREIPEGMFVCMKCEIGASPKRCMICDRPIAESEDICSNCKSVIFRSKNKD